VTEGDVRPRRRGRSIALAAVALVLAAAGCHDVLGPIRLETTRVTGVVVEGGRPVRGGWVEFAPIDGTVGNMRSAPIGPDGRFRADRVPVGVNRVGIVGAPVAIPNWRRYFDPLNSTIQRRTTPGSCEVTIDLLEELARARAARAR
jgi:hypothetical protein